jgi:hypothetical protein
VPDEPTAEDHGEGAAAPPDAPPDDGAVPATEVGGRSQEEPGSPAADTPTAGTDEEGQAPSSDGTDEPLTVSSSASASGRRTRRWS